MREYMTIKAQWSGIAVGTVPICDMYSSRHPVAVHAPPFPCQPTLTCHLSSISCVATARSSGGARSVCGRVGAHAFSSCRLANSLRPHPFSDRNMTTRGADRCVSATGPFVATELSVISPLALESSFGYLRFCSRRYVPTTSGGEVCVTSNLTSSPPSAGKTVLRLSDPLCRTPRSKALVTIQTADRFWVYVGGAAYDKG